MYTLITGGNRGLGLDVARKLVNSGSRVILTSRNTAAGQAARQSILDASQVPADHCVALQLDVSSEESIQQLADVIGKEFHGQVGTVVNNAGVYPDGWSEPVWGFTLGTNLLGPVRMTEALLQHLPDGAHIVNVTSGLGDLGNCSPEFQNAITGAVNVPQLLQKCSVSTAQGPQSGFKPCYCITKAMLNRASQLYARDPRLTGRGITCCAADPGWCRTDMGGGGAPRRAGQGGDSILHCIHNREGCNGGVWLDGRRTL